MCMFVLFPERLQRTREGVTEQVFTMRITGLNFRETPGLTMGAVLETVQRNLDNRNLHEDHTIDVTVFVVITGKEIWKMSHQNGRWQAMNVTNIIQREE